MHKGWLLLSLCLSSGIWAECEGSTGQTATHAEVHKLRTELSAALEANDAAENAHGVVVQPKWTNDDKNAPKAPTFSKVIVNKATLSEASKLRAEINQAVAGDTYAKGVQGDAQNLRELEAALARRSGTQQLPTSVVGSTQSEVMLGSSNQEDTPTNKPNIVDSTAIETEIDLSQLQRLQLSKRRTREMLVLKRIEEDLSFTLGADVLQWVHVRFNGSTYFVGRRQEDLMLIKQMDVSNAKSNDTPIYEPFQNIPLPAAVSMLLTFERWNSIDQLQEGLILLVVETELLWYRYDAAHAGFVLAWTWPLGSRITSIAPFSLEQHEHLAVASNQTLSIFEYDLITQEFWIMQRLQLSTACTDLAVLDAGRDLLLAVAVDQQAQIYAYNPRELPSDTGLHLQLRHKIDAPQIAHVAAFQMGGRSYLALGGQRPQILQYTQGKLLPRTVLGQNFGLVELFLAVPVRSYRDDLLLIVQHRVSFDTHNLIVLDTLVWNGEAFEASVPAPCQLGTHTVHGVSCMLDIQREAGLRGAALLRQGETPLLLVPRHQAESGLFRLHTELLPRNSELQDLQEIHEFLCHWVSEQDALIQLAMQLLETHNATDSHFEQVSTPELINEGAIIDALYVNDEPWTQADSNINMHRLLQSIRLLEREVLELPSVTASMRVKRQPQLFHFDYEQLDFDTVEVDELFVDRVNNVPFFVQNATLNFSEGTLNVRRLEVLQTNLELPARTKRQTHGNAVIPMLQLEGDLKCDYINNLPWAQFVEGLVWRHLPMQLAQLNVTGQIIFEQFVRLGTLNQLSFPGDYLLSHANGTSVVQAPKHFTQTLSVNAVDTVGTINGVDPFDAITLSDEQRWPGLVTFTQLEVTEELQLNGSAQGRQFEQAPSNPTLLDSEVIEANCHFTELIVNGPIYLNDGTLDNESYDTLFSDIAQRPADAAEELLIPSTKHFEKLTLPVDTHVTDGAINSIPIVDFVTKHTAQTLHDLRSLSAFVYFNWLELPQGLYDGVNLTLLLSEALRIDAPLVSPNTELNFVEDGQLLVSNESGIFKVQQSLNNVPLATGYQLLHDHLYLRSAQFEQLAASVVDVQKELSGTTQTTLNGLTMEQWLSNEMHRPLGDVYVQDLILPQGIKTARLHGLNATLLLNFLHQLDELPLLILAGQVQVENIIVSGSVQLVDTLNDQQFTQLEQQVIWLDRPNDLTHTRWSFEEPPSFAANLNVLGTYNEHLLPVLLADIVFRDSDSQTPTVIVGPKNFLQPVRILGNLQLEALNGIPFARFANKRQNNEFAGSLHIKGRLHVDQLELRGKLNDQQWEQISARLRYDDDLKAFVQRGQLTWEVQQRKKLKDLTVLGHFGNRSTLPLQQFFDELIHRNQPIVQLEGNKIFTGRLTIRQGAQINNLNGLALDDLLQQLIFVDDDAVTVHTPIRFETPVQLSNVRAGRLWLQHAQLSGCNVSEWLEDSVRVDEPWQAEGRVTFAPGALDNNALQARFVNELEMAKVLTLHTPQNLSTPLLCDELYLDGELVVPSGIVNHVNLLQEYENTLLINAPQTQTVRTPLLLQTLHVSGELTVLPPINGDASFNLSDVATLHEGELHLQTPLYFSTLHAPQLSTQHQLSGFDFNAWYQRSLWARGRPTQHISGNWSVRTLRLKQQQSIAHQEQHALYRRQAMDLSFQNLCMRLQQIFDWLPYQVKQLRRGFKLFLHNKQKQIRRIFAIRPASQASYLLLNERGCWSYIYRWNGTNYGYVNGFRSGPVDEVLLLPNDGKISNQSSSKQPFYFMTSFEPKGPNEAQQPNCNDLPTLQTWRVAAKDIQRLELPLEIQQRLQHQLKQEQQRILPLENYQQTVKFLQRPNADSVLHPQLLVGSRRGDDALDYSEYRLLLDRLLEDLSFRLHTEVNITQLSIPESDLFDEQLIEEFVTIMDKLDNQKLYQPEDFASVAPATLPLPNNPARVLAARSVQIIWPVIVRLEELHSQLVANNKSQTHEHQLCVELKRTLGLAVRDVLLLANNKYADGAQDYTPQLHAVIERLRELQHHLEHLRKLHAAGQDLLNPYTDLLTSASTTNLNFVWARTAQTLLLNVGSIARPKLLYAHLAFMAENVEAPATTHSAYIQLHHPNGTVFQSLPVTPTARQLTGLRVHDETLLAFVQDCCRVHVFIYRGLQGFVPFAEFSVKTEIVDLIAVRLPLNRTPGALYALAVAEQHHITFYELVVVGLFEPWLECD